MTRRDLSVQVKKLIATDKLKEAIELLLNFIDDNQLVMQSSNYHRVVDEVRKGTISWEDSKLEKNRIKYIILEIVDEIYSNLNPEEQEENIVSLLLSLGYRVTNNRKLRLAGIIIGSIFFLGEKKIRQIFYLVALALLTIVGFNIYFMIDSNKKMQKLGAKMNLLLQTEQNFEK